MLRRPHYIALSLVVLLTLVILNLPSKTTARLKSGLGGSFLPLIGLASSVHDLAGRAGLAGAGHQKDPVLEEQLKEALRENNRLRQLLGWQQHQRWNLRLANVILNDPANWWLTVQIDLGSRDGLSNNLPVLSPDGFLVGRISSVSLTRSQVLLLGDPALKVSARVENEAQDKGIISGAGPLDTEFAEMECLGGSANLKPGQNIVTWGEGGIFPRGIQIGKLVDVHQSDYGLRTTARIKLGANLNSLEEVWVMFP
jgi:rod shape-determining protein MreC